MSIAVENQTVIGELQAAQPFDLRTSIRFLGGFGACRGDQILTEDSITKAISVDRSAIVFRLTPTEEGVAYQLYSDVALENGTVAAVRTAVDRYLSLSDDLQAFYRLAEQDEPAYARHIRQAYGLHQVRFLTIPEIAVWALVSQRTPSAHALGMKRRIAALGPTTEVGGVRFQAFPELDLLASLNYDDWYALVRNERKAGYLGHLMCGLKEIGEDFLRTVPYADASKALHGIKGVGDFTASAILLRGFGRMDSLPLEMPQFRDVAARVYGRPVDPVWVRHHYGAYVGYWGYYLKSAGIAAYA